MGAIGRGSVARPAACELPTRREGSVHLTANFCCSVVQCRGLKKKLMMQAAAAAAAEAGAAEGLGESETVWEAGDDPLWLLQSSLDTVGALSDDLGNATSGSEPSGDVGGAAATPAAAATGQSKYKWSTTLDAQFVFDFKAAVPKETIGAMCWGRDVVGVMRSEAGAEGVFFVQTVTGAVVVKGSKSMAAEVFSSLLGTALGVFCPKWRVIATGSPEGKVHRHRVVYRLPPPPTASRQQQGSLPPSDFRQ